MRDRNKVRETNVSQEGRRTFSSRATRGEAKKLDEGRRTTRSIQEPHELLTSQPRVHIKVSLVDLKNEGGLKTPKLTRQSQRRSSLSTSNPVPIEESKSSPSSVSPRKSEALRSGEQDGSNTKGRTRNVMKNGQTLAAARAVSVKTENNVSRATRRSLSVTDLINDGMLNARSSRKRNSDFVSNSPPLKRFNRNLEKRENEEKENVVSVKCGDCGKKTGRLRLSHHIGVPICDTCESVRQSKYGNVQMSHKSCRVLLFDIKKQLGCINQTSSYIVSGDNLNPLHNQKGTKVSVGKRFKCEIQSGTDGKFRQGGEPTKYRVPKLRIKRIQSVDDVNNERHGPVERKVMSKRSSGRLNKDKTAVSTRSGRIRRPTYKIRLNETSSLNSNSQNRRKSRMSNSRAQSSSKHDVPLRRNKQFRPSVIGKKPNVPSISAKKFLQKYANQKVERKSVRVQISARSRVSNLNRKTTFSAVRGKIGISKTKDKVRTVITKSLKVHQKVTKIPYCCKTCQKKFGSTVEGKSHELSHDNRILKIIVNKYSAIDSKSTGKVVTSYDVDTGKCLQNLVWIPADIMKGDMMSSSVPEEDGKSDTVSPPVPEGDDKSGSSVTLPSTDVDKNKESAINLTCDGVTESSKDFQADSATEKDTMLEGTALVPSGIYSSETIRNNEIEDPNRLQAECAVTADTLEIKELNGDCKEPSETIDIGKPPEEHTVLIPSEGSKEESSHILQTDVSPKPSDNLENEHTNEINDSSEETVIDVGTEETNKIEESCNENQVDILDDQHQKPCIEASLESAPETGITAPSMVISSITIDKNTHDTTLANQSLLDDKDNESKPEITHEKGTGSETLSEEEPGVLIENETLKEGKSVESILHPYEQESLEKKHPNEQSKGDEGNDNTHVAGMVVESLMEQIFQGTQQDEEKKSEEGSKECSLNTIIETLSEEYNSNQDDRDHEKGCNGDNLDGSHINSAESKATDDTTLTHVEKEKEHPVDTYLEPISDDETECFDSFDV
ncbi:serine-rich adhesin for platelets [Anabrus simplex]|uniref:serine-rich adhesin for platelets n=1 Tax=Anabrus simplex TaxID=316456 RepID=UPI0035A2E7FC